MKILKCLLMIVTAPVVLVLTLFVWLCTGLIYISGLVLGLLSTVVALLAGFEMCDPGLDVWVNDVNKSGMKRSRTMGDETQCPASWLFGMNGSVFLVSAFGFVWKHHFKFTRR